MTKKAGYVPMATFPIAGDPLPPVLDDDGKPTGKHYNGWLLFLDELPIAPPAVQAAAYKLILDRMVGDHHLHKKVAIVGAGNLETDNALVNPMSTALQSRMLHLQLRLDVAEWLEWARNEKVNFRITSYIQFKQNMLYTFKPDHTDHTYGSPRTWHFASRILDQLEVAGIATDSAMGQQLLAGCISEGVALEFIQFLKVEKDLPKIRDIIADPKGTKVPQEPSTLFLLGGMIGTEADKSNIGEIVEYAQRMPSEFQVVCLREVVKRNVNLMGQPSLQKWIAKAGAAFFK